jgi:hypothetical protein
MGYRVGLGHHRQVRLSAARTLVPGGYPNALTAGKSALLPSPSPFDETLDLLRADAHAAHEYVQE